MNKSYYICEHCGNIIEGALSYNIESFRVKAHIKFELDNSLDSYKNNDLNQTCIELELCKECYTLFLQEINSLRFNLFTYINENLNKFLLPWLKNKETIIKNNKK